jgi:choline dehydrogenase-like flavoprotein
MLKSLLQRQAENLEHNVVAQRLIESFFPAGERLPAPDADTLAKTVAEYCQHIPGMGLGVQGLLQWLEWQHFALHGRRFSRASLAERQAFLRKLGASSVAAPVLHALSIPYRAAYSLDEKNLARVGSALQVRVPADVENERWRQQITTVDDLDALNELEADVVIIGTGAGGAAAAYELAKAGCAVVVLEEGRYHDRRDFSGKLTDVIPKLYRGSGATVSLGNTVIPIPVGKNVGGTTTINSGTCLRTPESTLRDWREHGLHSMTEEALSPWFEGVEAMLKVQRAEVKFVGEIGEVVRKGAEALGMQHAHPLMRNAEGCDGQGLCQFGCPTDAKQSTNVSYMPRALASGAFLFTGMKAKTLLKDGQKVQGVEAVGINAKGERRVLRVRADRVIVSAGTFFTPQFLHDNGVRNPWLGRNLSIHPAGAVTGRFPDRNFRNTQSIPQGFGVSDLAEEGIMFEGGTPPFAAHGLLNPFVAGDFVDFVEHYQQTAYFGFMIKDESRGRVRKGVHPDVPLITYSMNNRDFSKFLYGIELLSKMMLRAGADYVHLPGLRQFPRIHDERELTQALQSGVKPHHFAISAYHPLGTARLAAGPTHGVCDESHRVFGWEGLYVMDGASVPSSLGANPQVTIMALAARAARWVAEEI